MATRSRRILIVEDEVATVTALVSLFACEGHVVAAAADGLDALERMRAFRPDVVVTDLTMPRMDGLALLHAMRAAEPTRRIPAIVVSAGPEPDLTRLGPARFVRKPVDFDALAALIAEEPVALAEALAGRS